ncbi:hypothetical protein GCM10025857_12370 [Alicyclobacillus contaminans]|uniref:putative nucleotidyltransferase substrate binding domain-containing protein n=1 Tax=Alicyclobacillus contaminans TaxID=392016 RepID=UPI0003FA773D|nr:putative nucleotidyltransferase substrate binding domain-containing protein [Alicyclobacillus contaminans]GMA49880.1 hypothetical protein GCM10025857_12370 [Alicyclobacillus contaminans]
MIAFPPPDGALFSPDQDVDARTQYIRSVLELSQSYLSDGGDLLVWMDAFQRWRTRMLELGWEATVPAKHRLHLQHIRFGSAARGEELPGSDLDFAVVSNGRLSTEDVISHMRKFIRLMHGFGFPPCQGFVMGSNPRWVGTAAEWQQRIQEYLAFPDWTNTRYLFIMVDSRPLGAGEDDWTGVVANVRAAIRQSPFICWEMAHLGIHKSVAVTLRGQVKTTRMEAQEYFPVKEGLLNPLVQAVRLLALVNGCEALPTLERLHFLQSAGLLTQDLAQHLREALLFGWRLRLDQQMNDLLAHREPQDAVRWHALSEANKREAAIHVRAVKTLERMVHRTFPKRGG